MDIRRFGHETQRNYIRDVGRFATFLGRSPDTATAEEVPRFQVEQCDLDVPVPTMNSIVSALRFFFIQTLDRPDLARKLVRMRHVRKLNGNGKTDVLWRNDNGQVTQWVSTGSSFDDGFFKPIIPLDWKVEGSSDFF